MELKLGRYEYHSDAENSHKFWIVEKDGSRFKVRWGRVNTKGSEPLFYDSESYIQKKINGKISEGYKRVSGDTVSVAVASPKVAKRKNVVKEVVEKTEGAFDLGAILDSL